MLQNELLVARFRFDAAENELSEVELLTGFGDFDKVVMNEVSAKEERWLVSTENGVCEESDCFVS